MSLENKINKIPGCDQLTRPEEIQELKKYLGDLKKVQNKKEVDLINSLESLYVPGYNTGLFPKVELDKHVENILPNSIETLEQEKKKIAVPGQNESSVETLYGYKAILNDTQQPLSLNKKTISLENKEHNSLSQKIVHLEETKDSFDLETKKINNNNIEDSVISSLENRVAQLITKEDTSLEDKKIDLSVDSDLELDSEKIVLEDTNNEIALSSKIINNNISSSDPTLSSKIIKNKIEDKPFLENKIIKNNIQEKVNLENKISKLTDDTKIDLENTLIKPISPNDTEVTELYQNPVALKDTIEDKDLSKQQLKLPGIIKEDSLSDTDIKLKLEGDALDYYNKFTDLYINKADESSIFNLTMSLFSSLAEKDLNNSERWLKLMSVLSSYGVKYLKKSEDTTTLKQKRVDLNPDLSVTTTLYDNTKSIPNNDNPDINLSTIYQIVPPSQNNSGIDPYSSYLSKAVLLAEQEDLYSFKDFAHQVSKSVLGELKTQNLRNNRNSIIDQIATIGINALNNIEENNLTKSNSSYSRKRLKWKLPGSETDINERPTTLAENIVFGKDWMGNIVDFGSNVASGALSGYGFKFQKELVPGTNEYKKVEAKINKNYSNLSDIEEPVKNGLYLINGKVYKYQNGASSVTDEYKSSFKQFGNGLVGEFKKDPIKTVKNFSENLINGGTGNLLTKDERTRVYNRPRRNAFGIIETTDFEFQTGSATMKSTRKTESEKINSNLTAWRSPSNLDSIISAINNTSTTDYIIYDNDSKKLKLNYNSPNFKDRYLSSYGIQTTLEELCESTVPESVEALMDLLKNSKYITTVEKFGTTSFNNRFAQTLDSNACWELIIEPFTDERMNGGYSYLPAIQEINTLNLAEHGINTGYNKWIPISSFSLQKSKMISKQVGLFDGEFSVPLAEELVNDITVTIVDDQYKSWRNYFQKCVDVSLYNSQPHDSNYYKTGYNTISDSYSSTFSSPFKESYLDSAEIANQKKTSLNNINSKLLSLGKDNLSKYNGQWIPTAVDKSIECTALYKNVTFRIRIFVMTQQYSTIRKFDLLCVLRDFSEEFNGDSGDSATDLNLNFSIVGEYPSEHYQDPEEDTSKVWDWWKKQNDYIEEKKLSSRLIQDESAEERRIQLEALKKAEDEKIQRGIEEKKQIAIAQEQYNNREVTCIIVQKAEDDLIPYASTNDETNVSFIGGTKKSTQVVIMEKGITKDEWLAENPGYELAPDGNWSTIISDNIEDSTVTTTYLEAVKNQKLFEEKHNKALTSSLIPNTIEAENAKNNIKNITTEELTIQNSDGTVETISAPTITYNYEDNDWDKLEKQEMAEKEKQAKLKEIYINRAQKYLETRAENSSSYTLDGRLKRLDVTVLNEYMSDEVKNKVLDNLARAEELEDVAYNTRTYTVDGKIVYGQAAITSAKSKKSEILALGKVTKEDNLILSNLEEANKLRQQSLKEIREYRVANDKYK